MKTNQLNRQQNALLLDLLMYLILEPLNTIEQREKEVSLGEVLSRHNFDSQRVERFMYWLKYEKVVLQKHVGSLCFLDRFIGSVLSWHHIIGRLNILDLPFISGYVSNDHACEQIQRLIDGVQGEFLNLESLLVTHKED